MMHQGLLTLVMKSTVGGKNCGVAEIRRLLMKWTVVGT